MERIRLGIAVVAALLPFPTGCASPGSDARLAAIAAEVKALREEVATMRRAFEVPVEGVPDVVADPVELARFRNRQALTIDGDLRKIKEDLEALKKKAEEIERLSKTVDELKGRKEK